jgi:hypothetical protein
MSCGCCCIRGAVDRNLVRWTWQPFRLCWGGRVNPTVVTVTVAMAVAAVAVALSTVTVVAVEVVPATTCCVDGVAQRSLQEVRRRPSRLWCRPCMRHGDGVGRRLPLGRRKLSRPAVSVALGPEVVAVSSGGNCSGHKRATCRCRFTHKQCCKRRASTRAVVQQRRTAPCASRRCWLVTTPRSS